MRRSNDATTVVDDLYDAALDPGRWPQVLERFAHTFGGSSAHLSLDSTHQLTKNAELGRRRLISFGTDPAYEWRYANYYAARNVLWQRIVQHRLGEILTDRTIMPREELRRSEFYNDFLCPQEGEEILCSVALRESEEGTCLTLWRSERYGPWQPKDMKALAALTPHLRRALRLNEHLGGSAIRHGVADEALYWLDYGVMLVNIHARVRFANKAVEATLAKGGGLRLDQHQLVAQRSSDTDTLRRLIADASRGNSGGTLVISREERPSLLVTIVPLRPEASGLMRDEQCALVFVKDLERPTKRPLAAFSDYYGLTPAQEALAHELIRGDGVTAAATRLGVSRATVRTHLIHIFQKTGTKRQAELVRLLVEWSRGA